MIRAAFEGAIARELSRVSRYCDELIQFQPLSHDNGALLERAQAPRKASVNGAAGLKARLKSAAGRGAKACVLLNGNLNYSFDDQALLESMRAGMDRRSRVLALLYNPYWAWAYRLLSWVGLRRAPVPTTFLTATDLAGIASLSGYAVARIRPAAMFPFRLGGLGTVLDGLLKAVPGLRALAVSTLVVLRPRLATPRPSISIVIPARDERGNIEPALRRLPRLVSKMEVVFVEGHSSDGTWAEIQRVKRMRWPFVVKCVQQKGKGKADAVRLGFEQCSGDLLTVLDSDLTMPPEQLGRFYQAWADGHADFINGTRLVYPMEGEAMRSLNWLGNIFFAKSLSFTLEAPLADSLCGTKLFSRADYQLMKRWRDDFGDFDPFGDYEMLFPAAQLGLGIIDVPIRYRARTYGVTKIRRFRDGLTLLRMTLTGLLRIRAGS